MRTAPALAAAGFDDHVSDVPRVAGRAVEHAAVEHDAAADPGRHDHREVVALTAGGAPPSFTERERLGVVVDPHRQAGVLGQAGSQREAAPRGDVERRHVLAARVHGAAAADADRGRAGRRDRVDERGERREQRVGIHVERCRCFGPCGECAVVARESGCQLGAADVDCDDAGHGARG